MSKTSIMPTSWTSLLLYLARLLTVCNLHKNLSKRRKRKLFLEISYNSNRTTSFSLKNFTKLRKQTKKRGKLKNNKKKAFRKEITNTHARSGQQATSTTYGHVDSAMNLHPTQEKQSNGSFHFTFFFLSE